MEKDYTCETINKRATVYRKGKFFMELDNDHQTDKEFLATHYHLFDLIADEVYTDGMLQKILSIYNATYKGENYKKGQMSIYDLLV